MSLVSVRPAPSRRLAKDPQVVMPPMWVVRAKSVAAALVLAAVPVALWLESDRITFLFWMVVAPLSSFLGIAGYLGARGIFGTPR